MVSRWRTASALNAALHAKPVSGFSARVTFTNHLFPDGALTGSPLLAGASGRVWISNDGRFRLELQSDTGDTQITGDGKTISVYDASKGTLYRIALPAHKGAFLMARALEDVEKRGSAATAAE